MEYYFFYYNLRKNNFKEGNKMVISKKSKDKRSLYLKYVNDIIKSLEENPGTWRMIVCGNCDKKKFYADDFFNLVINLEGKVVNIFRRATRVNEEPKLLIDTIGPFKIRKKEVEFVESLTSATLKNVKKGYDYQRYVKLTNEKLNLNPSFSKSSTNISANKSKISFFEDVAIKALNMADDSRDLFWSMIYTIIKLSDTMHNKDEFEATQLYRNWEGFKAEIGGFGKFSVKWISDQIKFLYSEVEISEVLTVFDSDYNNTIDYLVENIVKRTETELPFQDPCLVNLLGGLLDYIRVFVDLENIEFSNINLCDDKSIKFDFAEIVAPSFCDIQDNGCDPYKITVRKIFIGKFFQLVLQDLYLDGCEIGSEDWKLLNKYKKRFFLDKYLIEFLKSKVEEYSKKYLL